MEIQENMRWNADKYDTSHSFVTRYGQGLVELLAPQSDERILDIGCGTGHLTKQIADTGASTIGLDNSTEMIALAKMNYPEIEFVLDDFCNYGPEQAFDALFSNAALHWILPPESAVVQMSKLLRSGGRLVAEFGGHGNVARICTTLEKAVLDVTGRTIITTNYYPKVGAYSSLLEQFGFEVSLARLYDRPTQLEGGEQGLVEWLRMFRKPVIDSLCLADQAKVFEIVQTELRTELFNDGCWYADYRRLQVVAIKCD